MLYATPDVGAAKGRGEASAAKRGRLGGSLNADWVEWLMNWPIRWTSLEPLEDAVCLPFHPEPDIPRVITGQKDRAKRLMAIGNGQVPLCFAAAWRLLTDELD